MTGVEWVFPSSPDAGIVDERPPTGPEASIRALSITIAVLTVVPGRFPVWAATQPWLPMISSDPIPIPLLQAEGLAYARNDEPVFGPLDFTLNPGEVVLIEGDNGSGKTTLLKVLSGLLEPNSGKIRLNGEELTLARLSHQVALLGHLGGLKLDLTALENLRFAIGVFGLRSGAAPLPALASVGLEGYEDVPVRNLSAGQKKRVSLARLLLVPAALWLLDEPYANLDKSGIDLVNRLLDAHARRGGAALVTSHGAYAFTSGTPRRLPLRPTP